MPELTDEERISRQRAVDFARGSVELSEGKLNLEAHALNARYVAGELSADEHIEALLAHARSLLPGEPAQAYFTSFKEAIKAARA